jgi:hypothetical protein
MGKILPFGEWLPDQAAFGNPGNVTTQNCYPRTAGSYGPFPTAVPHSAPLPAQVCGSYGYRDPSATAYNFAATPTDLYLQTTGNPNYSAVSGPSAPYNTELPPDGFWSMTSFGKRIIATNYEDPIQTYLVDTDTAFSDLAAAAPRARYACVLRDFLLVGNTYDATDGDVPYRLWWPAIGDPLTWPTPGTNQAIELQSDFQDLVQTDLGDITGITGGHISAADGAIFCERGIYRVSYAGSPAIFDFAVAEGAAGTDAPLSIVERRLSTGAGVTIAVDYYLGSDGFYAFDGSSSVPIGAQKVDRTFFNDLDVNFLGVVQGTYVPDLKLILWFYHGRQNNGHYNKCLAFNWELQKWAPIDFTATPIDWVDGTTYSSEGFTLDELDPKGTLDTLQFSLDSRAWTNSRQILSWFDTTHAQNYITGPSMRAVVETGEQQLFPGRRARIVSTRPIADSAVPVSIAVGTREMTRAPIGYQIAVPENILGDCPQRCTGRYARFQMIVPAGANFNHLQGIDVTAVQEGFR